MHFLMIEALFKAMLEMAGRIVAKWVALIWATKFIPKDCPENEFGQPNLGGGYRKFSAYLQLISEINLSQTAHKNLRQ